MPFHEMPLDELRNETGSATASTDCRVCIFVDDLDEFEGPFRLLIGYLKSLADGERVKICLGSRPEVELKHTLTATPSIRMQEYNISTIRAYVKDDFSNYAHCLPDVTLQRMIDKITMTQPE